MRHQFLALVLVLLGSALPALEWQGAPNIVLPARRVIHAAERTDAVRIERVAVAVEIRDRVARTVIDVFLHNPGSRPQEAELCLPVPVGCMVTGLDFAGGASEPQARLLPREEARQTYEAIVASMRDPAVMEFVGSNLIRSSVFPVPPGGGQRLQVSYEEVLPIDGQRLDYHLPRSDQLRDPVPWEITVDIHQQGGITSIWSPSHALTVSDDGVGGGPGERARASVAPGAAATAGAFRLHLLLGREALAASVLAFPDRCGEGGWFVFLAGAPELPPAVAEPRPRDLTIVIDRSGSMKDGKLAQVCDAARRLLAGLRDDETFSIISYHHGVERFASGPVAASAAHRQAAASWLAAMTARGGTNIHDALHEALRQEVPAEALPLTIFLTDGVATVGETSERAIRELARRGNGARRRIFPIGVGLDVDTHLLEKLADDSRAIAAFLRPDEDIAAAMTTLGERLRGPVLCDLALTVCDDTGRESPGRIIDRAPTALGDLFAGQQVLLTGRYLGAAPCDLVLSGSRFVDGASVPHRLVARLDPAAASTVHGHVPRLWATRRIAELVDAVRSLGADDAALAGDDPRYRELVDEIVRLSREFGVLTEYTAFFATEGALPDAPLQRETAAALLRERAIGERAGVGSWAQSYNGSWRKSAAQVHLDNRYLDATGAQQVVLSCQPQAERAYFQQGERWVDSQALSAEQRAKPQPDREIAFASPDYFALAERLAQDHRQSVLANRGELLLVVDEQLVLVRAD